MSLGGGGDETKRDRKEAHHEDGREHGVDAVRPDAGAVQDAAHERQLIPEQRAVLDAEEDLEMALRTQNLYSALLCCMKHGGCNAV